MARSRMRQGEGWRAINGGGDSIGWLGHTADWLSFSSSSLHSAKAS